MRHGPVMAVLAMMPLGALAATLPTSAPYWHKCATNDECIVVPGICAEAAVNAAYKKEATAYYKAAASDEKCPDLFWKPKTGKARCRLEACEIAN